MESSVSTVAQKQINWSELSATLGAGNLRPAAAADAIDGVQPQQIAEPGTAEGVAKVLRWAATAGLAVAPRGGGTKLAWGNPPARADLVLSTRRMNRVLEHAWADLTVSVEAGCTIQQLQQTLAQHGQQLALDPLWPERASVGGILATNDSGSLRVRFGGLRDLIIGITVVLPDGTIARSGGKVVKNVAGYDLQKLMTGALGTLGVITEAIFRLYPLPREVRTLTFAARDYNDAQRLLLTIQDSTLEHTGLQARVQRGINNVDVRLAGTSVGLAKRIERAQALAGSATAQDPSPDVWLARQSLWEGESPAAVCKVSVLPASLAEFCQALEKICHPGVEWQLVAQGTGLGTLRLQAANTSALAAAITALRAQMERSQGSLVVLDCPREIKTELDVWGSVGDTLPLMRRVKQQFDPAGMLNPGRFIGRI